MKKIIYSLGLGLLTFTISCSDKDLDPTLEQQKELDSSLVTLSDIETYMNGVYSKARESSYLGRDYIIYGEIRSDNTYANGNTNRFITEASMDYPASFDASAATWYRIYEVIGRANLLINKYEGIGGYKPLQGDEQKIKHYVGQAYILRAMGHFDLLRIFGEQYVTGQGGMNALAVPYVKHFKGDPQNPFPKRNTVQQVYDLAKADLKKAVEIMDESLNPSQSYKVSSFTAWAVLSRMATYLKDYPEAEVAAKKVIDANKYQVISRSNFVNSWAGQTSTNWIFSLYSNTSSEKASINGLAYIYRLPSGGSGYGDVVGLGNLYDIYDAGDIRIDAKMVSAKSGAGAGEFRNIGKFPDTTNGGDAIPVIRYEEVILDYAEALLNNGNTTDALTYLNMIPSNRGANVYSSVTMDNILLERRKEFAFEGHRMFDLVRTSKGIDFFDNVRQRTKEVITAGSHRFVFPISATEMEANSNMKQNKGY